MQGQLAPLTTVYISHMHLQLQRATTTTTTRSIAYHTVYTCVQQQCCTLVSLQLSLTSRDTRSIRAMHACLQIKIAKERMDLARLTLCCALILIPSEQCPPPPPSPCESFIISRSPSKDGSLDGDASPIHLCPVNTASLPWAGDRSSRREKKSCFGLYVGLLIN